MIDNGHQFETDQSHFRLVWPALQKSRFELEKSDDQGPRMLECFLVLIRRPIVDDATGCPEVSSGNIDDRFKTMFKASHMQSDLVWPFVAFENIKLLAPTQKISLPAPQLFSAHLQLVE